MSQYQKVAYYTLGCKLNFSETSTIARQLSDAGYARVNFDDNPDIYVINTCSVTDNADKKCRYIVSKALKVNPNSKVFVIGCYAQLKPKEILNIPGVTLVLGANEKFNLADHIEDETPIDGPGKMLVRSIKEVNDFIPSFSYGDRTRSFLKIQDGCDYFCSFCTIPLARGKSRSATVFQTVAEAQKIAQTDIKEVVLTGVNIGDFGVGTPENFFDLVKELDNVQGVDRYRISSIEPNLLSDEIIDFVLNKSQRIAPHFHIPLQSGSDRLLQAMRRKYNSQLFVGRIKTIKKYYSDTCIGVDVIVGFPGETEEEFLKTYKLLSELDVSYLHVFSYSERPQTIALKLDGVVPKEERTRRSKMLQILSQKKKRAFYQSQLRKVKNVLFENENHDGFIHGFTENYVKVRIPFSNELKNTMLAVQLSGFGPDGIIEGNLNTRQRVHFTKQIHET